VRLLHHLSAPRPDRSHLSARPTRSPIRPSRTSTALMTVSSLAWILLLSRCRPHRENRTSRDPASTHAFDWDADPLQPIRVPIDAPMALLHCPPTRRPCRPAANRGIFRHSSPGVPESRAIRVSTAIALVIPSCARRRGEQCATRGGPVVTVSSCMDTSDKRVAPAFSRMQERDGRPIARRQTFAPRPERACCQCRRRRLLLHGSGRRAKRSCSGCASPHSSVSSEAVVQPERWGRHPAMRRSGSLAHRWPE
jgi:hypothetical protein